MSPARLRMLSEPQLRRVLVAGGMLVESGGQWRAYRSQDARHSAAGGVSPLVAARLRSEGVVTPHPQKPGRFLASALQAAPRGILPPPAGLLQGRPSHKPRSLAGLITAALASEPSELSRLKAATGRFLADMGQVSRRPLPRGSRAPQAASGGLDAALARLGRLEAAIGRDQFRHLEYLLAHSATAAAFARDTGLSASEANEAARAALEALVKAYDLAIRPQR